MRELGKRMKVTTFTGSLSDVQKNAEEWKASNPLVKIIDFGPPISVGYSAGQVESEGTDWSITVKYEDQPSNSLQKTRNRYRIVPIGSEGTGGAWRSMASSAAPARALSRSLPMSTPSSPVPVSRMPTTSPWLSRNDLGRPTKSAWPSSSRRASRRRRAIRSRSRRRVSQ